MYKSIIAAALLAIVQCTFLDIFSINNIRPNISIIGMIYFALMGGRFFGFYVGLIFGLIYGLFSSMPFPLHALSFSICGYLAGWLAPRIYGENRIWYVLAGFVFSATVSLCDYIAYGLFFGSDRLLSFVYSGLIPVSAYTAIVSPFIFFILARTCKL